MITSGLDRRNGSSPLMPIEHRIAEALHQRGEFHEALDAPTLAPILSMIMLAMMAQQQVAGAPLGVQGVVEAMRMWIDDCELNILWQVAIHRPVDARLQFAYKLENAPREEGDLPNLRLKPRTLQVTEQVRRFDVIAQTALKVVNVPHIVQTELSDPARVVKKTLPARLALAGFRAPLRAVSLNLRSDDLIEVGVWA